MKKTELTRSLLAACSIVALTAVMYGCVHGGGDTPPADDPPPAIDTDGDGVPDDMDAFDDDPTETMDSDGDGVGDNADAFDDDPTETMDSDGDGVGDNADAFDDDPTETMDSDGDGVGDNADWAPMDAAEQYDSDGDNVGDNADAFDDDPTETMDSDGDGVGDNAQEAMALNAAQMAADAAADAAEAAADAAEMAANGQMANQAADPVSYALAQNAATRARAAATAARAASDMAAAATVSTTALAQQAIAEARQRDAMAERDNAVMYAQDVADDQQAIDDENQRQMDVADARDAARDSYMAADNDARMAEEEADEAEATAPGSPGAMAARNAATAARNAANAAKAAHDAIMDAMTKAQADAQAAMAADQAAEANSQYMTAKAENDTIQTAASTGNEQQRERDVEAATDAAGDAAMAARESATAAREAATAARMAADAARDAYMMAMRARTDSVNAEMEYMEADAAATAAENAATAAEMAASAAEAAHMGIDAAGSAMDAQSAQMTAETKQGEAADSAETASMEQMTAETAQGDAEMYAGTHVIGLLEAANASDVMDVDERDAAIKAVAMAIGDAAGTSTDADNDSSTTGGGSTSTATASWPANTPADMDATPPTEEVVMPLMIAVTRTSGTDLVFRTEAAEEDDTNTADVDETIVTATEIDGLPGFEHGYSISDRGTHAIVFTDKKQAVDRVDAKTVTVLNAPVQVDQIAENDDASFTTGSVAELTSQTKYDHDDDPETLAVAGTYTCQGEPTSCRIEVLNDMVVDVTGTITFSATPDADSDDDGAPDNGQGIIEAVEDAKPYEDYLVFGVWLQEDSDTNTDGNQPAFGAFANGGSSAAAPVTITGTATYEGSAAGVKATASAVDFFSADATLMADFRAEDEQATLSGKIHNIVAGGENVPHDIYLDATAGNVGTNGSVDGSRARKGDAITGTGGDVTYPFNGTWSAQFYNAAMNDPATPAVDESTTMPPGSVAGTFGVTMGDNMDTMDVDETTSFVGAFGAHMVDDPMNGN